jgi:chromosome segregation ATPase
MATNGVEAFLAAEEEANRLVDELERLKVEIQSYAAAREAIDNAGTAVSRLASELTTAAGGLASVVETLRTIGTPELLRSQEAIAEQVASLREQVERANAAMTATASQMTGSATTFQNRLEQMDLAAAQNSEEMKRAVVALTGDIGQLRAALDDTIVSRLGATEAAVSSVRRLVLTASALILIGIVLVGGLVLTLPRG